MVHFWEQLLGADHVLKLQNPDDTSESIAMTIGLNEGVINRESAQQQMVKRGKVPGVIERILRAIGVKSKDAPLFDDTTGKRRL